MRKAMILLSLIYVIQQSDAQDYQYTTTDNLVEKLNLIRSQKWALDGSVFQPILEELYIKKVGNIRLVILSQDKSIKSFDLAIDGVGQNKTYSNSIYIDNQAPIFDVVWQKSKQDTDSVRIGTQSIVTWDSQENNVHFIASINGKPLPSNSRTTSFSKKDTLFVLKAVDEFGNTSTRRYNLTSDFEAPLISWNLESPAIFKNNQWIAGEKTTVNITAQDESGLESLTHNKIQIDDSITLTNNQEIIATDFLGNKSTTIITWQEDKQAPLLLVNYSDKNQVKVQKINARKVKVAVKEDITLSVVDKGIGIKSAKFLSKNGRWENLPKTFTLLHRGKYNIRVVAEDLLGNKFKTTLTLRAKNRRSL